MLVVAIIGILAAVAIPSYQGYTVRAKLTEAIVATTYPKTAVAEAFQTEGMPGLAAFATEHNARPHPRRRRSTSRTCCWTAPAVK